MNNPNPPKSKCRWFQFRLRTSFVLTFVVAVALTWPGWRFRQARNQQRAVIEIEKLGGSVGYGDGGWLQERFGDTFAPVDHVSFNRIDGLAKHNAIQVTDAQLVHLEELTNLQRVWLPKTQVTDAGLVHLKGQTSLKGLYLSETQVTDAGLVHLRGLTRLTELDITDNEVADAGLVHLKGLTSLQELYLYNTQVTDAGLVHLRGLTSLQCMYLRDTQVTDEGVERLRQEMPNCVIYH